ncbi:DUF3658 domain-containing protein [Burkholderia pyrrocinia]|uniref:DUF3658 domain-containing protein n=1 Tax=Burkholderia pyrrocinia TaxID=60550 RepID=UPI002AB3201B|nr:DUF3658 domain-containing protein [Burkholderia pyrrocinia]
MSSETNHAKVLHTTFSEAAFDAVSSAVASKDITGSCILINGDWHFGPLKNRNIQTLTTWFIEHFGYTPENITIDEPLTTVDEFKEIYTWVDALSSDEYANFLHWISASRPRRFFMVSYNSTHIHSALSNPDDLTEFLSNAVKKRPSEIDLYIQEWNTLTDENSDFRLINPIGKIQSFMSSSFDKYIIDSVTTDWEPSPLPVLRIMENLHAEHQQFPGDIFLYHRLDKLVTNGVIEKQADSDITQTQIRSATL